MSAYVEVTFPSSGCTRAYRVPPSIDTQQLTVGDFVITSFSDDVNRWRDNVERDMGCVDKVKVARIDAVRRGDPPPSKMLVRYFLAVVPVNDLRNNTQRNTDLREKLNRQTELTSQLDKMLAKETEADRWRKYQTLALRSDVARDLLQELASIKL